MMAVSVGDVVELDGVPHKYLGGGVWQPVGETLAKRFDMTGEELMPGVRAAMERTKCD